MFSITDEYNSILDTSTNLLDITKYPWSPFLYIGRERSGKHFKSTSLLVYDVDINMSINEFKTRVPENINYYISYSRHHQKPKPKNKSKTDFYPPCDRFRIIFPLATSITSALDYKALWQAVIDKYNLVVDAQASDVARFYYPSNGLEWSRGTDNLSIDIPVKQSPVKLKSSLPVENKGRLSRATTDFISLGAREGEWHKAFIKAGMDLKEQGYSQDESQALLAKASPIGALDEEDLKQLDDIYEHRGGALSFRPKGKFPVMLPLKGKEIEPKPDPKASENYKYYLTSILGLTIKKDLLENKIEINEEAFNDTILNQIIVPAGDEGLSRDRELWLSIIDVIATEHSYHPLKERIEGRAATLPADKDYIAELFNTINIAEGADAQEIKLYKDYLYLFFNVMIRKIYGLPSSGQGCLTLLGGQGTGKSRWLDRIGADIYPKGYITSRINPDDKENPVILSKKFLWVVEELDAVTSVKDAAILKDFFDKKQATSRRPYARLSEDFISISSFAAATNAANFLTDLSGNRRYWIIPIDTVEANHKIDVLNCAAQAYRTMVQEDKTAYYFDSKTVEFINALNDRYINMSPIETNAMELLDPGEDRLKITEIYNLLELDGANRITKTQRGSISGIITRKRIKTKQVNGCTVYLVNKEKLLNKKRLTSLPNSQSSLDLIKKSLQ